jgi:pimeloyl-ACP methyl ester carboxylesterase
LYCLPAQGWTGEELILLQAELIARANGVSEEIIAQNLAIQRRVFAVVKEKSDTIEAEREIRDLLLEELSRLSEEEQKALGLSEAVIEAQTKQILSPWFRYFLTYDPRPTLSQVRCPVLVLNGEKDLQVPPSQNLPEIVKALEAGGNREYAVIKLADLNHLFQTSRTGSPSEYAQIEETFSPKALEMISAWMLRQVR